MPNSSSTTPTLLGRMVVNLGSVLAARGSQLLVAVLVIAQFLKGFGQGYFKPLPLFPTLFVVFGDFLWNVALPGLFHFAHAPQAHANRPMRQHLRQSTGICLVSVSWGLCGNLS